MPFCCILADELYTGKEVSDIFIKIPPLVRFTVKLADIPIEGHALYPRTKKFCKEYLTDEPPEISVSVFREDIRKERKLDAEQMKKEGRHSNWYSGSYFETLALCRKIMAELINQNVLLFHGAVMAVDGKAYMFTAKSGTGKTTHCRLWLKNIPNCHILNGDKPLLLFRDGKVYACGSLWQGKEHYGENEILPLEGICILQRDKTNHIEEITLKESLQTLINQCHIPNGKGNVFTVLSLIKQLSAVELYRLGSNMEDEAAFVSYHGMVKE